MPIRKRTEINNDESVGVDSSKYSETKHCPFCDNEIKAIAIKCQYCKEWLTDRNENPFDNGRNNVDDENDSMGDETEYSKKRKNNKILYISILVIIFLVLLISLISKYNSGAGDNFSREIKNNISDKMENDYTEIENDSTITDNNTIQSVEIFSNAESNSQANEEKVEEPLDNDNKSNSESQNNKNKSQNQSKKQSCSAYPGTVYRSQDGWCACPGDPVGTSSWNSSTRSCSKNKTNNSRTQQNTNSQQNTNNINCSDPSIVITCSIGGDACPTKCKNQISSTTKNEVNQELYNLLQTN